MPHSTQAKVNDTGLGLIDLTKLSSLPLHLPVVDHVEDGGQQHVQVGQDGLGPAAMERDGEPVQHCRKREGKL